VLLFYELALTDSVRWGFGILRLVTKTQSLLQLRMTIL